MQCKDVKVSQVEHNSCVRARTLPLSNIGI